MELLGPKKFFVTGLVNFVTAVARLVCLDLLGWCLSRSANIYFGPSNQTEISLDSNQIQIRFKLDRTCVCACGWRPREPPPEPCVPECGVGGHPRGRVPLQAATDEVQEEGVVATLQRGLQSMKTYAS